MLKKFWGWYEGHYHLNVGVAAGLFVLQLFHLAWLLSDVVWQKIFGFSLFHLSGTPKLITVLVDYTEIPALFTASLIYIDSLRHKFTLKSLLFLIFLNSQWLHLFWITDEFVVDAINSNIVIGLPGWFAWIAILIDYLELPVIYDTIKRFVRSETKEEAAKVFLEAD